MKQVTQMEIAREAEVSRSTVAMVLSNNARARISDAVRKQVLEAAERLGYRPNLFAQTMRTGRSGAIGVICFSSTQQLSIQKLMVALELVQATGYRALLQNVVFINDKNDSCLNEVYQVLDARVEGVLLINPPAWFLECGFEELYKSGIPIVSLGGSRFPDIPKYLSDKEEGFYQLTRYLIEEGYRRIELMTGWTVEPKRRYSEWHSNGARAGFRRAAEEAGLTEKEARVGSLGNTSPHRMEGQYVYGLNGMRQLIERGDLPEAVIFSNDSMAIGALTACGEHGIRVPGDLAVAGFENETLSAFGMVPLTTFAYPLQELTQMAVSHLVKLIDGDQSMCDSLTTLCGHLVVRKSTRKISEISESMPSTKGLVINTSTH